MLGARELWHLEFLGNELGSWTLALATFLVTFTILPIITRFVSARRRRLSEQGIQVHFAVDLTLLLVERTNRLFLWAVALYLASRHLVFPPKIDGFTYTDTAYMDVLAGLARAHDPDTRGGSERSTHFSRPCIA